MTRQQLIDAYNSTKTTLTSGAYDYIDLALLNASHELELAIFDGLSEDIIYQKMKLVRQLGYSSQKNYVGTDNWFKKQVLTTYVNS